jgi:V8-like Glu-specific endopeptidase
MKKNFSKVLMVTFVLIVLVVTLSITPAIFGDNAQSNNSAEEFAKNYQFSAADQWMFAMPAICSITTVYYGIVYDPNTQAYSQTQYIYGPWGGTGFVVNPENGTIVTAGHMVDAREADEVNLKYAILDQYISEVYPDYYDGLTTEDWNWIYENYKVVGVNVDQPEMEVWVQFNTAIANIPEAENSSYIRAEVKDFSNRDQRDIAILRITPATGRALSSVLLGDSSMVKIGEQLSSIGYPYTADYGQSNPLDPSVFPATISGRRSLNGVEVLQVSGYAEGGSSGGPVINKDGQVIGLVSAGTDNMLNILRTSNDIKSILSSENKLGQVDLEWRTGLAMFNDNHYSEALKHFDAVLNLSSGHKLAQEYKAKAQANMGSDVPFSGGQTASAETTAKETVAAAETTKSVTAETSAPIKTKGGMSTGLLIGIIAGGLILVVLIVVLIVVLTRKKAPQPTVQQAIYTQPQQQIPQQPANEGTVEVKGKAKFCPSCGGPVVEGAAFCPSCGSKLGK